MKRSKVFHTVLFVLLIAPINFWILNKINHSILFPHKQTTEEMIEVAESKFKLERKKADNFLAKGIRFSPQANVVDEDKKRILSSIKELFMTDSVGQNEISDSIHLKKINSFLNKNYDQFDQELFKDIKNSIELDFITYSPDYTRFVVTFSYRDDTYNYDDLYKYEGFIFIGEKSKSQIDLFNYSRTMYQHGFYKRKSVLYSVLGTFSYLSTNLIDDQHRTHPHVLTREFWSCPFFFEPIKLSTGEYYPRFKTEKKFVYQKPSKYVKKESVIIPK